MTHTLTAKTKETESKAGTTAKKEKPDNQARTINVPLTTISLSTNLAVNVLRGGGGALLGKEKNDLPSTRFSDDHFGAEVVESFPQVFRLEGHFGVILNTVVFWFKRWSHRCSRARRGIS